MKKIFCKLIYLCLLINSCFAQKYEDDIYYSPNKDKNGSVLKSRDTAVFRNGLNSNYDYVSSQDRDYTSRIRRFHRPFTSYSYWNPYYTNYWYYNPYYSQNYWYNYNPYIVYNCVPVNYYNTFNPYYSPNYWNYTMYYNTWGWNYNTYYYNNWAWNYHTYYYNNYYHNYYSPYRQHNNSPQVYNTDRSNTNTWYGPRNNSVGNGERWASPMKQKPVDRVDILRNRNINTPVENRPRQVYNNYPQRSTSQSRQIINSNNNFPTTGSSRGNSPMPRRR